MLPSLTDALAVRSLTQGMEFVGLDPVYGWVVELGVLLFAACYLASRGFKLTRKASSWAWNKAFPPPEPPPEPDPVVAGVLALLAGPCVWAPNKDGKPGGLLHAGPLEVKINHLESVGGLLSDGRDLWMDLLNGEQAMIGAAAQAALSRLRDAERHAREAERRARREAAARALAAPAALAGMTWSTDMGLGKKKG